MIDTHQHLIFPGRFNYSWTAGIPQLQQPLGLEAYRDAIRDTPVEGSVFVEVDVDSHQNIGEAKYLCQLAEEASNSILGIVAAARPENDNFLDQLDALSHPAVKGIRRVLHTQDHMLSLDPLFRRNVRELSDRGLSFDLCVLQRQLAVGIELVRDCPNVSFILDHAGVPDISENDAPNGEGFKHWRQSIHILAAEPNCSVKLSGLPLYATEEQRSAEGLSPYIATLLEAFGPRRIVWGGDWPVCNLAGSLSKWCKLSEILLAELSESEQKMIFSENALRIYKLKQ